MASLTAPIRPEIVPLVPRKLGGVKLTDSEIFYHGGYYGIDLTTGRLTEMTDVATVKPLGILDLMDSDTANAAGALPLQVTGNTSASPEPKVTIGIGEKMIRDVPVAGASAITDVGELVYLTSDNVLSDLTLTSAVSLPAVGYIVGFSTSTTFDVILFSAAQMRAGTVGGFGYVDVPLNSFREVDADGDVGDTTANGGVLASDTTPVLEGATTTNAQRILWATGNADRIASSITLPADFDGARDVVVQVIVASAGTTDDFDATLITNWDGGADVSDTVADTAATAVHASSATVAAADVPDNPLTVAVSLTPPAHATDIFYLYGVRIKYRRK